MGKTFTKQVPADIVRRAVKTYNGSLLPVELRYHCHVHTNEFNNLNYRVDFDSEEDYTWFILMWS